MHLVTHTAPPSQITYARIHACFVAPSPHQVHGAGVQGVDEFRGWGIAAVTVMGRARPPSSCLSSRFEEGYSNRWLRHVWVHVSRQGVSY